MKTKLIAIIITVIAPFFTGCVALTPQDTGPVVVGNVPQSVIAESNANNGLNTHTGYPFASLPIMGLGKVYGDTLIVSNNAGPDIVLEIPGVASNGLTPRTVFVGPNGTYGLVLQDLTYAVGYSVRVTIILNNTKTGEKTTLLTSNYHVEQPRYRRVTEKVLGRTITHNVLITPNFRQNAIVVRSRENPRSPYYLARN